MSRNWMPGRGKSGMVRMRDPMGILLDMKLIVLAAGIALAFVPQSRAGTLDSIPLWFRADVTITPGGRATDLAWRNYTEMPEVALADLERRIAKWKFLPGTVDGQ